MVENKCDLPLIWVYIDWEGDFDWCRTLLKTDSGTTTALLCFLTGMITSVVMSTLWICILLISNGCADCYIACRRGCIRSKQRRQQRLEAAQVRREVEMELAQMNATDEQQMDANENNNNVEPEKKELEFVKTL